jgi:hypothetical protein
MMRDTAPWQMPPQDMEFLAYKVLQGAVPGWDDDTGKLVDKQVILGTPLYVAHAD